MKTFLFTLCLLVLPFAAAADVAAAPDAVGFPGAAGSWILDGEVAESVVPEAGCADAGDAPLFPEEPLPMARFCTAEDRSICIANCTPGCTCRVLWNDFFGYCFCEEVCS